MRRQWAALAVGFAVVVLAASLVPTSGGESFPTGADKLLHVVGYAAIAFAAGKALEDATDRALVGVVVGVTVFGAGVELLQPVAGRATSGLDALANLVGAVLGALATRISRSR
jgi:VanZ family protein